MSSFKVKNRKKVRNDIRVTLDAKHTDKVKYFKDINKQLPQKKKTLEKLKTEYNLLNKNNFDSTDQEINYKNDILDEINELDNEIKLIESNKEETDYLLSTGKLLFQYYENMDAIAVGKPTISKESIKKEINNPTNNVNTKSVIDFFHSSAHEIPPKPIEKKNKIEEEEEEEEDELLFEENEKYNDNSNFISKEKLLNKYLNITENNYVPNFSDDEEVIDICKKCNIEKILIQSTGVMVCQKCGEQENIIVDSDKPSYKDPPREISYFAYKRINHFNELIICFSLFIIFLIIYYY